MPVASSRVPFPPRVRATGRDRMWGASDVTARRPVRRLAHSSSRGSLRAEPAEAHCLHERKQRVEITVASSPFGGTSHTSLKREAHTPNSASMVQSIRGAGQSASSHAHGPPSSQGEVLASASC